VKGNILMADFTLIMGTWMKEEGEVITRDKRLWFPFLCLPLHPPLTPTHPIIAKQDASTPETIAT
jgi:hypothetical protein